MVLIFCLAFILNYVWEHVHAPLYANYRGGVISEFVLDRAVAFDAMYVTIAGTVFLRVPALKRRKWLLLLVGCIVAVVIEWLALTTRRWDIPPQCLLFRSLE